MGFPQVDLTPAPDFPELDLPAEYRTIRHRVMALVRELSPAEVDAPVETCPGWRIRDVIAHQAGATGDVIAGNLDGAPGDEWTSAQVEARRERPIDQLLDEWEANAVQVEPLMPQFPEPFTFMVADAFSHENDLLSSLGRPVRRDNDVVVALAARLSRTFGMKIDAEGLAPLRIRVGDNEWVAGAGEPQGTVVPPDAFEFVRAGTGRRSVDQIKNWEWDVDPAPYIPLISLFEPRPTALTE